MLWIGVQLFVLNISTPVFHKCCPIGFGFNGSSARCVRTKTTVSCSPDTNCRTVVGMVNCEIKLSAPHDEEWEAQNDGLYIDDQFTATEYCVEEKRPGERPVPIYCAPKYVDDFKGSSRYWILSICSFVSALLIFIVFVINTWILPRLGGRQGPILRCYLPTVSLSFFLLCVQLLFPNPDVTICISVGYSVQFFFLATFFWLNVMCFDIYWAFSGMRLLRGSASERDRLKMWGYSLYAWGMPLLILLITISIDFTDFVPPDSIYKPGIGTDKCFFRAHDTEWIYFYGPMAVIVVTNSILFGVTAFRLFKHRQETAVLNRGDSRRHDGNDSERFNLYLKLFLVMGINWIAELVSFIFGDDVPRYFWYVTDITNTLQGVFIFLIFVWKKRVRRLLWAKLCGGRPVPANSSEKKPVEGTSRGSILRPIDLQDGNLSKNP